MLFQFLTEFPLIFALEITFSTACICTLQVAGVLKKMEEFCHLSVPMNK